MLDIILIGCTKRKREKSSLPRDLYEKSPLFRKPLAYTESLDPDVILVLSGKDDLLEVDKETEPYDITLKEMSRRFGRGHPGYPNR